MTKFDIDAILNHKLKAPHKITEKNQPDLDKMAKAFFNLLKK